MRVWLPLVEGAVRDLESRQVKTSRDFDRLADSAKARAFAVAGINTRSAAESIRDALIESVEQGSSFRDFKETVESSLGSSRLGVGHLENVFRTNIGKAYMNGLHAIASDPMVAGVFPYRERLPIRDSRLSEICRVLAESGIGGTAIYRADDPVWAKTRPPSHWCCRCGVRMLTVKEAARRGVAEAQAWLATGVAPTPSTGWVPEPLVSIPDGWVQDGDFGA